MKRFLLAIMIMAFGFFSCANAATTSSTTWTSQTSVDRVNRIGKALLAKSNLPTQITFQVIETDEINAFANADKQICVYTGLLKFVANDDELAGVIAHEIGHIVNNHVAKQSIINTITTNVILNSNLSEGAKSGASTLNNLTMLKMSRSEEYEADITGVDLMTNAGYNPLAMVSVLYKISGNFVDFTSTHPSGDKRTMYIYDYITYTYPDKAKGTYNTDSYNQFMLYAKPIVDKRNSTPKKLAAFNKKQEKLKAKRIAKMNKYKTAKTMSGWDKSFMLLKSFSAQ